MSKTYEANFDGLVGPTHCYAGLSYGNVASMGNRKSVSNPREAVTQGLIKAKALHDMGFKQGVLAPQERPDIRSLRRLGFSGRSEAEILAKALKAAPELLAACASASSMWTANAATVSPSADSADGRVHFTAANLNQKLHRAIEHRTTTALLRAMFPSKEHFGHHVALPLSDTMGDEGAANHTRFCGDYGAQGVQFFVYGREALRDGAEAVKPKTFPARHTREASESIARLHQLKASTVVYGQQDPRCIDTGAFHNDVVSVGNQNMLFYHENAFLNSTALVKELRSVVEKTCGVEFVPLMVPDKEVPLVDAVKSYLFNSQLVTVKPGHMMLIAPGECEETPSVARYLKRLLSEDKTPLKEVRYFDLRQSMRNGGGPACLRLRVVLNDKQLEAMNSHVLLTDKNYEILRKWADKHYRDRLMPDDLADPSLLTESRAALDDLTQILHLGSVYPFQQG